MIQRCPKESIGTTGLRNRPKEIVAAIHNQRMTKRWAINRTIQIHSWLFKPCSISEQVVWSMKEFFKNISSIVVEIVEFFH
jgi:hypothetical protein